MSRYVTKREKLKRIFGFSIYLAFIIAFVFLFFIESSFWIVLIFLLSIAYFFIIFYLLMITKHTHFNILMKRGEIKDIFYKTKYRIIDFISMKFLFTLEATFFTFLFFAFYSTAKNAQAIAILIIFLFSYFYFFIHNIIVYLTKEGIIFDYAIFIVLLRWDEIKGIDVEGNKATIRIKQKHIKRTILIKNPKRFRNIVSRFVK